MSVNANLLTGFLHLSAELAGPVFSALRGGPAVCVYVVHSGGWCRHRRARRRPCR